MDTQHNCGLTAIHLIKHPEKESDADIKQGIDELLKPVDALDLDFDSDYSEISDIFEEYHKESFLRTNADPSKKHLTKIEADWKTVEQFTDEFKKAMVDVREELELNHPLFQEEEVIQKILNSPPLPKEAPPPIADSPIPIEPQFDQFSEASSESLVWQRLLKNSEGPFKVSPPVFDAFRQEKKHWLHRPSLSWRVVENCRIKCDKWLDQVVHVGVKY